jgi:uroporphyrinogen III methyltransferase/synthase
MPAKPEKKGKVYLIGAGPGDPGLLTIKGAQAISASDLVVYDYLVHPAILAHSRQGAELVYVGKQAGVPSISQQLINEMLVSRAEGGQVVARLKGGDPFVFGRGGEEAEALAQAGIEWEVIPGVSSGVAAAAYAGIPVTHRDYASSVAFLTAHAGRDKQGPAIDWAAGARQADTLVVFMCAEALGEVAADLIAAGRKSKTPVAVVRWGTYEHQEVYVGNLEDALNANPAIKSPAIAIIGDVVALRKKLRWVKSESEFELASEPRREPEARWESESQTILEEAAKK